ncbi:MAG: acyltransferase [Candidatus Melainabacteria bacterium]|nr:acyltransferase [Candidatus Melainabacteria bacterium]
MKASSATRNQLDALTSLRFFAAMMVVCLHLSNVFPAIATLSSQLCLFQGVSFFFVLSGFILFYSYQRFDTQRDILFFWCKRIARLWPLHLTTFLARFTFLPTAFIFPGPAPSWIVAVANLCLLNAWIPHREFYLSYNSPSWSISTELFFYLAMPGLIPIFRKSRFLLLALATSTLLVTLSLGNAVPSDSSFDSAYAANGLAYVNPFSRLLEFTLGMCIADIHLRMNGVWDWSRTRASIIEALVISILFIAIFSTLPITNLLAPFTGAAGQIWISTVGVTLLPFTLVILVTSFQRGAISQFLASKVLVFLGEISFAIYLVHAPLIELWDRFVPRIETCQPLEYILIPVFLCLLFALSHLAYRIIEIPSKNGLTELARSFLYKTNTKSAALMFSSITGRLISSRALVAEIAILTIIFAIYLSTDTSKISASRKDTNPVLKASLENLMMNSLEWKREDTDSAAVEMYFDTMRNRIQASGLVADHQRVVLDKVSAQYLILSTEHLAHTTWNRIYVEFRKGEHAPYRLSTLTDWEFVDYTYKSRQSLTEMPGNKFQ